MARIVLGNGPRAGEAHVVGEPLVLGRQKGVQVLVDDINASREHAKVFLQDGEPYVVDLNSRNGTKVNGEKITRRRLADGDVILIGTTEIRFEAPESAALASRGASRAQGMREQIAREREAASAKAAGAPRGRGDGSGVVVRERILQYGRLEDSRNPLQEDVSQRGGLGKLLVAVLGLALLAGIAYGIAKLMAPGGDPDAPPAAPAK